AFQAVYFMFAPPAGAETNFNLFHGIALVLLLLAVVAGVVAVTQAQRKIPVQYAQRMVGRKVYAGQSSFMPLRVNYAGVMPIIFAQAILMFPSQVFLKLGTLLNMKFFEEIGRQLSSGQLLYYVLYTLMILFFSYFWVATMRQMESHLLMRHYDGFLKKGRIRGRF